jgi:dihydrofolate reductase
MMTNSVYIATSLDGYIADKNGSVEWLESVPNPDGHDMGFHAFMNRVDALIMGRNTFEMVLSFGVDWPYAKPVIVLSHQLTDIPSGYEDKITLMKGPLPDILSTLNAKGLHNFYIDGGKTIQQFLNQDLIDEMIITTFPMLLGGGSLLFGELETPMTFKHLKTEALLGALVQNHYVRP